MQVVLDEDRGQRRGEGQCHQRRQRHRDRHGNRELLVDLAREAAHEGHRHEHRRHDQRRGDDRPTDLFHGANGGIANADIVLFAEHPLDVLHHQYGVIHHDTDRQHQREQRQQVDREVEQVEAGKGTNHRDRHHRHGDDGKAPVLQEDKQNHDNDQERFDERLEHRLDGRIDEQRRIVRRHILEPRREAFSQIFHGRPNRVGRFQRVGARLLVDDDGRHGRAVQPRIHAVERGAQLDPRHVFQAQ